MTGDHFDVLNVRGRANSLGFIRYFLAALVVFSHSFTLGRFGPEPLSSWTNGREKLGSFAVACFFVLSGFLISHSYASVGSLPRFLWHRFLRIFPAFLVCLVVVAFGFGVYFYWVDHHTLRGYVTAPGGAMEYVVYNAGLVIRRPIIAGTLATAALPHINGALWTLSYEFGCYLVVALIGVLGLLTRFRRVGLALTVALLTVLAVKCSFAPSLLASQRWLWRDAYTPKLLLFFLSGVVTHFVSAHIRAYTTLFILAAIATAASLHYSFYFYVIGPVTLAYALFWLGLRLPMSWWDKRGDFSYGVYIYGFPVQQLLTVTHVNRYGVVVYFVASLGIATLLAVGSFYCVERPVLRLKNMWRGREQG